MEKEVNETRVCPKCGKTYRDRPATSRDDGRTPVCPDCGVREALAYIGITDAEQDEILATIHRFTPEENG